MHRFAELLSHGNTLTSWVVIATLRHSYVLDLFAAAGWHLA